jgi:hypothetical protein
MPPATRTHRKTTRVVRCGFGAVYAQTEVQTKSPFEGIAECEVCGYPLTSWSGSRVLSFELLKNPTG